MKFLFRLILSFAINGVALFLAARFVSGVHVEGDARAILALAFVFTLLNWFLKPVLKLVLSPIILITLGFALLAINAFMLYILDVLSDTLTIDTVLALVLSTIVVSLTNAVLHVLKRT